MHLAGVTRPPMKSAGYEAVPHQWGFRAQKGTQPDSSGAAT